MATEVRACLATALRCHAKAGLSSRRAVSDDPEAVHLIPVLLAPRGLVGDTITHEQKQTQENFRVPISAISAALSKPGWWHHTATERFAEMPPVPEEAGGGAGA